MTATERRPLEGAVSSIYLKIDGQQMSRELFEKIDEISVESSLQLPDVATFTIRDPLANLLDDEKLKLGTQIQVMSKIEDDEHSIFDGEIVEIEPRYSRATQFVRFRAFDRLHKLARGTQTRSFQNVSDMDLVKKIAGEVGLSAKTGPSSVVHAYVLQHNQTNLAFLRERVSRLGYILYVDEKTLYCEPPKGDTPLELTWGDNLYEFFPRLTSMRQTSKSTVRSWDPKQKRAVVGQATKGKGKAQVQEKTQSEQVGQQAFNMDTPTTSSSLIVRDQGYAAAIAEAQRNVISEQLLEARGLAAGYPRLTAGNILSIKNVGKRFSGDYVASSVRHVYRNGEGYSTEFVVSGSRADSLASIIQASAGSGSGVHGGDQGFKPVPGLMIGIVTNNDDPDNLGRVKVKLPSLTEDHESDWARVVNIGGGTERGTMVLPEVNDEVLVGFEHDDIHHPYILGGLWNGTDKPPYNAAKTVKNGKVIKRVFKTRLGHEMTYDDPEGSDDPVIKLKSSKNHEFTLNDGKQPFIKLKSNGSQEITLQDGSGASIIIKDKSGNEIKIDSQSNTIRISSNSRIELKASSGITIDGGGGPVDIRGVMINLN